MSLSLTLRTANGAPLTASQNDANLTGIQSAVNATDATVTALSSTVTAGLAAKADITNFETAVAGKLQVKWSNVTEKPSTSSSLFCFRGQSSIDQTPSVVTTATQQVHLNSTAFDDDTVFDTSAYTATIETTGKYQISFSVEVGYTSGTTTGLGARAKLRVNGTNVLEAEEVITSTNGDVTLSNSSLLLLADNDVLDLAVEFRTGGTTVFSIQGIPMTTFLTGYLVKAS